MGTLEKETFLRVLKGAPLSVLIGLWVHGAMDQGALRRKTGYDEKTLRDALAFLSDLKLVERSHYRKWSLTDGFFQLPLVKVAESGILWGRRVQVIEAESGNSPVSEGATTAESGNSPVSEGAAAAESGISPVSGAERAESGNSPVSGLGLPEGAEAESGNSPVSGLGLPEGAEAESGISPVSEGAAAAESGISPVSGAERAESGNSPVSAVLVSSSRSTTNQLAGADQLAAADRAIVRACRECGIFGAKQVELARTAHVAAGGPEYVRGHVEAARREGARLGLAIWRMLQGWPVPAQNGARDEGVCPECGGQLHGEECLFCLGVIEK